MSRMAKHGLYKAAKLRLAKPADTDVGVWFRAAASGLWYRNHKAAGTIFEVRIDGKSFYR
jgi:hypothetical protein